jgi:two-component system LytT family response regulator
MSGPIRAIIVDDEPLARRGLELRLRAFSDFEIVAQCGNGREAVEAVARHAPDLMFLDIEMPGVDGFEVLRRIPQASMPMVVFVTAFDRYAVEAFDAHALDYLLKPLVDERFERTMAHVRDQFQQRKSVKHREQLVALLASVTGAGQLDAEELLARGAEGMPRPRTTRRGFAISRFPIPAGFKLRNSPTAVVSDIPETRARIPAGTSTSSATGAKNVFR